jgi:hypothetical protein
MKEALIIAALLIAAVMFTLSENQHKQETASSDALSVMPTKTTTTTLPAGSVYWKIPKKLNPCGGYDSIQGWYESESPDWEKETWLEAYD